MKDMHIGIVGPTRVGKATLAQALTAKVEELFSQSESQNNIQIWEVKCKISIVNNIKTGEAVNKEYYNQLIKGIVCEVDKPLKVFFENGGFFVHQVLKSEPEKDEHGFWLETTTKRWRFDYI